MKPRHHFMTMLFDFVEDQNMSPQGVPLWYKDCADRETGKRMKAACLPHTGLKGQRYKVLFFLPGQV